MNYGQFSVDGNQHIRESLAASDHNRNLGGICTSKSWLLSWWRHCQTQASGGESGGISDDFGNCQYGQTYRRGIGTTLVKYSLERFDVDAVDCNEQNFVALAFYERIGFKVTERKEIDDFGNPFPILTLRISERASWNKSQMVMTVDILTKK